MLSYTPHEKLSLKRHAQFNEAWLHDRICETPQMLGLGDVRVLDRERAQANAGRLDILLLDEDNNRRYEVEVMLGATDPSHILRTIEYWDIERRRYPGYDHVAVLIAEDVTTRFLNLMALLSGSIPMFAIQLDALQVGEQIVLNFVKVLDQTDLRVDDTDNDSGGGEVGRAHWDSKIESGLMSVCDEIFGWLQESASGKVDPNYLKQYIGLRVNGSVNNLVFMSPKSWKKLVNIHFRHSDAIEWKERFEEAGTPVSSRQNGRFVLHVTSEEFASHRELIHKAVVAAVKEAGV